MSWLCRRPDQHCASSVFRAHLLIPKNCEGWMISPLRRKKGKKGWASKFKGQLKSSNIFHIWPTPCLEVQDKPVGYKHEGGDYSRCQSSFYSHKRKPRDEYPILDLCDYVCIHFGLPVHMNCRAIVTNFWVFEMKGLSFLELTACCFLEFLQSELII